MRILLVGVGRWGEKHLRVLRALGAEVWVADVSPERRRWAVARGVAPGRVVEDYRAALGAVDAVDIVTPADSHVEVAAGALAAGRHCFVEKPLATTVAGGLAIAAAAAASGRMVQVGHIFRFHPVTQAVRDVLATGLLGRVRYATGRFASFKRPRTDVGVTHTDAVHYFDLFAYLLGRPATRVRGLQRDFLGGGLDDMSVTIVEYGEVPVLVEANCFEPGIRRDCALVGEGGTVSADYASGTAALHLGQHRRHDDGWEAVDTGKEELHVGRAEPLELELRAFVDACAGRRSNPVPAEAGVEALRVVEAASEAARRGAAVVLLGTVAEKRLRALYRGAAALAYPSFYEGFGLPLVEAMACGTPVIAFNRGSVPEVVDDGVTGARDEPVQELVHAIAAERDLHAYGHALTELEVRNGLPGPGDHRLLAGDARDLLHDRVQQLRVLRRFADPDVDNDLLEARDLVGIRVAELLHELGPDPLVVMDLEPGLHRATRSAASGPACRSSSRSALWSRPAPRAGGPGWARRCWGRGA